MVQIEHRALGALEDQALVLGHGLVNHGDAVGNERAEPVGIRAELGVNGVERKGFPAQNIHDKAVFYTREQP